MVESYNWYEAKVKRDMALMIFDYLNNPDKIWDDSKGYGYIDIGSRFDFCKLLIMVNRGLIMDGVYSTSFKINTKRLRIVDIVWEWNIEEEVPLAKIMKNIDSKWREIDKFRMFLESANVSEFIKEKGAWFYFNTTIHCLPFVDKVENMVRCMGIPNEIKWNGIDSRGMLTMKLVKHLNTIDQEMWNFGQAFYNYLVSYTTNTFNLSDEPNFFKHKISIYRDENRKIIAKCDENISLPADRLLDFLIGKGLNDTGIVIDNPESFITMLEIIQ